MYEQGSLFYVHLCLVNFPDKHCICRHKCKIRHTTFEICRIFESCPLVYRSIPPFFIVHGRVDCTVLNPTTAEAVPLHLIRESKVCAKNLRRSRIPDISLMVCFYFPSGFVVAAERQRSFGCLFVRPLKSSGSG